MLPLDYLDLEKVNLQLKLYTLLQSIISDLSQKPILKWTIAYLSLIL